MQQFIALVGLPACGKSTWASEQVGFSIVSSDSVRKELYGAEEFQGDANFVFQKVHGKIVELLNKGDNVIFDATNLSYKHRMALLQRLKNIDCYKKAVVFAVPFEECLSRNSKRERRIPDYVIENMRMGFTMPQYFEGWDEIEVLLERGYERDYYPIARFMDTFSQDNVNHNLTLGKHIEKVVFGVATVSGDEDLYWAAKLHDIGKLYTKKFENSKGEPSESAHFYGHEHVSAYEAIFYVPHINTYYSVRGCSTVAVCGYIQFHMRLQQLKDNQKGKDKLKNLVGAEYYSALETLYIADCNAKE